MKTSLNKYIKRQTMTVLLMVFLLLLPFLFVFIKKDNSKILNSIKSNLTYNMSTKLSVNHLDTILTNVITNSNILANLSKDSFSPNLINNKQGLANYLNSLDNVTKQIILNTKGVQGVWIQINPDLTLNDHSYYVWYYFKDKKLAKYPRETAELNYTEDAYYFDIKNAKKPIWTDVYIDPELKLPVITYGIPLYKKGKFIGEVGIDISLEGVNEVLKYIHGEYKGSELYLVTQDSKIISSFPYNQNILNKNLFSLNKNLEFLDSKIKNAEILGNVDYKDGTTNKIAVFSHLSNHNYLIITVPTSTIYKEFSKRVFLSYIMFVILSILAFYALSGKFRLSSINHKLEQQTSLQKILLDSFPDLIFFKDNNGQYLGCNPAFAEFIGKPREEIIGKTVYDFFTKDVADSYVMTDLHVLESGDFAHNEQWLTYPDGKRIRVDIIRVPYYSSKNELLGLLGVCRDITERKKAEMDILKAKEQAEKASQERADFLANMSHEIRTPMNGVLGYIQLLAETELTEEQKDFVQEADKSSELLLSLINDILDFSKIEAGKMLLKNISFDIRSLIEDVATLATAHAYKKGLEVNALIYSDVPQKIYGDPGRLKQVLNNLVGNAVKFTEKGEVIITARTVSQNDNSIKVLFEVEDTGIGIPEEAQQAIFDAFVQADSSATRKFGGTGLGLAISKNIIEMMNGNITLESEVNKGSKFSFTTQFMKDLSVSMPVSNSSLINKNILIVDDNQTNLNIAHYYLEGAGCIVYEANSAYKALEVLESSNIDVMIIDYNMPEINGFELASKIKSNPKFQHIKLILLTSLARRGDSAVAVEKGFVGYLTKPVRKYDLLESILLAMQLNDGTAKNKENVLITKHVIKENYFNNKFKILVVEDNEINQKLIVKILSKSGYTCDIASNGLEAVNAYKNNQYSLILMDCQMPEMDGYQATKEIRTIENMQNTVENNEKHIPIIALTAYSMEGDIEKCVNVGMDSYLSKPVDINKLYNLIGNYLPVNAPVNDLNCSELQETDRESCIYKVLREIMKQLDFNMQDSVDLLKGFLENSPESVKKLKSALDISDFDSLKRYAHTLKGTSANLRIENLRALYLKLENGANSQDKTLCDSIINEIEAYLIFLEPKSFKSN